MRTNKTVIVIGATGLVGSHLVQSLLDDSSVGEVKIFVRRILKVVHPKLTIFVVDFDRPNTYADDLKGDVLYSCMGTTIKTAGSKDAQYKVDFTYQYQVAEYARKNSVGMIVLVSATGADSKSSFFYARIKGELEEAIMQLKFESTLIVRPSVLIGDRAETRWGEKITVPLIASFSKIFLGLKKYRGIKGEEVAMAMLNLSNEYNGSFLMVELDELFNYTTKK